MKGKEKKGERCWLRGKGGAVSQEWATCIIPRLRKSGTVHLRSVMRRVGRGRWVSSEVILQLFPYVSRSGMHGHEFPVISQLALAECCIT